MIESYDFGWIIINGTRYTADCIVTEHTVNATWWRRKGHELAIEDIRETIEQENPQAIVVGKGKYGSMKILPETRQYLEAKGIEMVSGTTDAAVKRYNELMDRGKVIGFFHLTC
jgi:hypothetical protein